jgi:hypothetical protein
MRQCALSLHEGVAAVKTGCPCKCQLAHIAEFLLVLTGPCRLAVVPMNTHTSSAGRTKKPNSTDHRPLSTRVKKVARPKLGVCVCVYVFQKTAYLSRHPFWACKAFAQRCCVTEAYQTSK